MTNTPNKRRGAPPPASPDGRWTLERAHAWAGLFGSIATVLGAVIGLPVALVAVLQWRGQVNENRQDQAQKVSAWIGTTDDRNATEIVISNASSLPVYQPVITLVFVQGPGPRTGEEYGGQAQNSSGNPEGLTDVATPNEIPPGRWAVKVDGDWGGMMAKPGAEIGFTDAAGRNWIRRSSGKLDAINSDPPDHYKISRPFGDSDLTADANE